MTLRAVAELAGITESHLSRIERGERIVGRRSLLEAIAAALRVAPSELAEQAFPPAAADPVTAEAQAGVIVLEAALSNLDLGEVPDGAQARPWPAVAADMNRFNTQLRPTCDHAGEVLVLPGLLSELHALYVTDPDHRADVLAALMDCYQMAGVVLKILGVRGLPTLAAFRAQRVAEELDDPAWFGLVGWLRGHTLGGAEGRPRMLELSMRGADALAGHLDDPRAQQMYGALHLHAAVASAAMCRADDAADHLDEAGAIATRVGTNGRGFGGLCFGPDSVGLWRVSIAVELGDPGRAHELARQANPARVPSAARQSTYWADLGRGMASERATREQAVGALLRAEQIAPQRIRLNPFVRETVGDLIRRARSKAVGRELRGMAYRMGLGVG